MWSFGKWLRGHKGPLHQMQMQMWGSTDNPSSVRTALDVFLHHKQVAFEECFVGGKPLDMCVCLVLNHVSNLKTVPAPTMIAKDTYICFLVECSCISCILLAYSHSGEEHQTFMLMVTGLHYWRVDSWVLSNSAKNQSKKTSDTICRSAGIQDIEEVHIYIYIYSTTWPNLFDFKGCVQLLVDTHAWWLTPEAPWQERSIHVCTQFETLPCTVAAL